MKKTKKVNPYEKKQKRRLRITRKQWIALISLLGVVAMIAGIVVMANLGGVDPHAGHDHGEDGHTEATDEHGHAAGSHGTSSTSKFRFQSYNNDDGTYDYAIYNSKNELLLKREKLTYKPYDAKDPSGLTVVYCKTAESGYTSGDSIYCDDKNQRVSEPFHGVLGTDGTRVAYCSDDDTTVIVQDLFDKKAYYKEYPLPDVVKNGSQTVKNGHLSADKKTVTVTYTIDDQGNTLNYPVKLYD